MQQPLVIMTAIGASRIASLHDRFRAAPTTPRSPVFMANPYKPTYDMSATSNKLATQLFAPMPKSPASPASTYTDEASRQFNQFRREQKALRAKSAAV
ncbi:hypothetical protein H9P43_003708 [Blastocladiella emersonii ATCC 22665]|nr:hypothetical protein H9P43_003708 [Blastocladiella emersonii ATCC 22665]